MRQRTMIAGAMAASVLLVACGAETDPESAGVEVEELGTEPEAEQESAAEPEEESDPDSEPASADADDGGEADDADSAPEPDEERLADPCAEHEGREDEAFIDLVAPVDEQVASGEVELVGCSNVFEANVVWRVLDGDGETLDEGFTTAECGTGCVGEFRDTVSLEAAADEPVAYLQVFSPNASDEGPEQLQLTEVSVVLE